MTNLPVLHSEESTSFQLLDQRIQRWIWDAHWTELRDAQDRAIPLILDGSDDLIISASTATGKTEAALFPILTRLAQTSNVPALAMYVSPLKALINDQFRRLEQLADKMDIPVTSWHGDISQRRKALFLKKPHGCLLITPESLEAILLRHGHGLSVLLAGLQYVVIDELHAFMGTERGKQLQSLLHRVEKALGRRVCRIGLSATLGDMQGAAAYLRPEGSCQVTTIESRTSKQELKVQVKCVMEAAAPPHSKQQDRGGPAKEFVAKHMFEVLRGSSNLVFPNSRSEVEFYSDRLRRFCEDKGVPNEFWPHHGNLSKQIREETEHALKQTDRPATAICTTTLELGIDIGPVASVVQIGSPPSVASLRQRLGRSGRRKGEPMVLRAYCIEENITSRSGLSDLLREGLVCTMATVRLLAQGWYEPINTTRLHASTLVQQVLSTLAQHGGAHVQRLWKLICGPGPFAPVSKSQFLSLLKELGQREIIFQDTTGLLLLAPKGEMITQHYTFYAAFTTEEEFRILSGNRTLGSMPITRPLAPGSFLIFAGRRWQVLSVSQRDKSVDVQPAAGGTVPKFNGAMGAVIHDRVREEMRNVLRSDEPNAILDQAGQDCLLEARENYARLRLDHDWLLQLGTDIHILLWRGDCVNDTLSLMLLSRGFKCGSEGISIRVEKVTVAEVREALAAICSAGVIEPMGLASAVQNKVREKWDHLLPPELLDASFASSNLDVPGVMEALKNCLEGRIPSTTLARP